MMMDNMMNDPSMKEMHKDKMMSMCKDDSPLFKVMRGKTMEMCDANPAKCKIMMGFNAIASNCYEIHERDLRYG